MITLKLTEVNYTLKNQVEKGEMIQISHKSLRNICRSKSETYNLFKYGLKVYLPNYRLTPFPYLKDLLREKKNMIYKD